MKTPLKLSVIKCSTILFLFAFAGRMNAQLNVAIINYNIKDRETIISSLRNTVVYIAGEEKTAEEIMVQIAVDNAHLEIRNLLIFSHGAPAQFMLGSSLISGKNVLYSLCELSVLKKYNKLQNVYVYACSVASGSVGEAFVNNISSKFDVNVKASKDYMGKGGNWDLEYGNASDNSILNKAGLAGYSGSL